MYTTITFIKHLIAKLYLKHKMRHEINVTAAVVEQLGVIFNMHLLVNFSIFFGWDK